MQLFYGLQAAKGKKVATIDCGYIAMEVAADVLSARCDVKMSFAETQFITRLFTLGISKPYEDMYESNGVKYVQDGAHSKSFLTYASGTKVRAVSVAREGKGRK